MQQLLQQLKNSDEALFWLCRGHFFVLLPVTKALIHCRVVALRVVDCREPSSANNDCV